MNTPPTVYQWQQIYQQDLFVLRNVIHQHWGLPQDLFSIDTLKKKYPNFQIFILQQTRSNENFKGQTKGRVSKMKNYLKYMRNPPKNPKYIQFVTNTDIGTWTHQIDQMRKYLAQQILWGSKKDILKHIRQHVLGVTLPQLYLKVQGCWTGGHQENIRIPAANINHGPGDVQWWGLNPEDAPNFRKQVQEDFGFDIYLNQTTFWPPQDYCLKNGFRSYYVVQKPGDLILVGPGTIHWVRSLGVTVNSAWNYCSKTLKTIQNCFQRNEINSQIRFQSIIPLHTLCLDYLNIEMMKIPINMMKFIMKKLKEKMDNDSQELKYIKIIQRELNKNDNILFCTVCQIQIFRIYVRCQICLIKKKVQDDPKCFFCLKCYAKHSHITKGVLVQKFCINDFEKLKERYRNIVIKKTYEIQQALIYSATNIHQDSNVHISPYTGLKSQNYPLPVKRGPTTSLPQSAITKSIKLDQRKSKNIRIPQSQVFQSFLIQKRKAQKVVKTSTVYQMPVSRNQKPKEAENKKRRKQKTVSIKKTQQSSEVVQQQNKQASFLPPEFHIQQLVNLPSSTQIKYTLRSHQKNPPLIQRSGQPNSPTLNSPEQPSKISPSNPNFIRRKNQPNLLPSPQVKKKKIKEDYSNYQYIEKKPPNNN